MERRDAAVERGPHPSALEHRDFLRSEMLEMCQRRQWVVLPYSAVRHLPGLRVSPPGVIPQRDRRPRTIVDYTFSGVNGDTQRLAPPEAMQFGRALWRLLHQIHFADPRFGPVHLCKVDVADGFYQVWVGEDDVQKLGLILPGHEGDTDPLIAFPMALPMGWVESPPAFCAVTETAADLANAAIRDGARPAPHRHDDLADTPTPDYAPSPATARPAPRNRRTARRPLAAFDVYVDDFIGAVQGGKRRRRRIRRILFHAIDSVLRPNDAADAAAGRKDPISAKKLGKGDGAWETTKLILGWLVDTVEGTIKLPPHRVDRLRDILAAFPRSRRRASIADWQQLVGELRSMALAIPGGGGCFSLLQEALRAADKTRVRLTAAVHDQLDDFRWLAEQLVRRPTRLAEIIPDDAGFHGACDAAAMGMGGVYLPEEEANVWLSTDGPPDTTGAAPSAARTPCPAAAITHAGADTVGNGPGRSPATTPGRHPDPPPTRRGRSADDNRPGRHPRATRITRPIVWRDPFPAEIQRDLVSWDNPRGTVTNSDLELAASVGHTDVLAQHAHLEEATVEIGTDNTPTLAWRSKESTTTTGPAAYLLRLAALHRQHFRYQARFYHLRGVFNKMADDASRLVHLSDQDFLAYFNSTYPLQSGSWQLHHLRPEMRSALISSLRCKRAAPREIFAAPNTEAPSGPSGLGSAPSTTSPRPSTASTTRSPSSPPSHDATATAASPSAANRSAGGPSRTWFAKSPARSPSWGPTTHG